MNISKELLDRLNVVSMTIKNEEKSDILSVLTAQEGSEWTLTVQNNELLCFHLKYVHLQINFTDGSAHLYAEIKQIGQNYLIISLLPAKSDLRSRELLTRLADAETQDSELGRRKENRITIGKTNAELFGLSAIEQKMFLSGVRIVQPCALINASLHGICIITPLSLVLRNAENFNIRLNFKNPEENVILKVHKVYMTIQKAGQKSYVKISCQILEPVHYSWRLRISKISRILDKKRTIK